MMKISLCICALLAASPHVFAQPIEKATEGRDFALCSSLFNANHFQLSLQHLEQFLQKYPDSPKRAGAVFLSAECLFSLNQHPGATKRYEFFLREFRNNTLADSAIFRLGEIAFRKSDYRHAITEFKKILDHFPDSPLAGEAAFWSGESYFILQEYQPAQNFYRISSELYPHNRLAPKAVLSLGWTYHSLRDYGKALETYTKFLARFPRNESASLVRQRAGECSFHQKDYSGAISLLTGALPEISNSDLQAETEYLIGESYFNLGDHANALFSHERFQRNHKKHRLERHVRYSMGWTFLKEFNFKAAASIFGELAEGNDEIAHAALFQKGIAHKMTGESEQAEASFLECSKQKGEFRDNAVYELGLIEYAEKNYAEAKALFLEVTTAFSHSDVGAQAFRMSGEASLALGQFGEAREAFRSALMTADAPPSVILDAKYQEAWSLLKMKEYADAAEKFEQFISAYPDDSRLSEAYFWLGEAHYHAGNYPRSAASYAEVINSFPQNSRSNETFYGFAWANYRMGDYPTAAAAFEEVLKSKETHFAYDARMRLGDCYFALHEFAAAAGAYRVAARQFDEEPGIDFANYRIALCATKTEKHARALFELLNFIALFPQSEFVDDAMYDIGSVLMEQKDYRSAIRQFKSFSDQFPQSPILPKALIGTGEAYLQLKDYRRSLEAYNKVLAQFPVDESVLEAITGMQECLVATGRGAEALKAVDDFLQRNPGHPFADRIALRKPDFLFEKQEFAKAAAEFEQFIKEYPNSNAVSNACFGLAMSYRATNRSDEALQAFANVVSINPNSLLAPPALFESGMLYAQQSMYTDALRSFDELLSRYPESEVAAEAEYEKGKVLLAADMLQQAEEHFESVGMNRKGTLYGDKSLVGLGLVRQKRLEFAESARIFEDVASRRTDETGAEAQFRLGEAFFLLQQYQESIVALQKVTQVFGAHKEFVARAFLKMGECYEMLSDKTKAQEAYRSVLRLHKNDEFGKEAERKLKGLRGA